MEDQKRGMAPPEEIARSSRERGRREKRITVMIMRNFGGVRSFKISPVLVLWSLLFFVAFMVVSVFAINGYLDLRRLTADQKRQLFEMVERSRSDLRDLQKAEQRIALLKDYIQDLEEKPLKETRQSVTKKKPKPLPKKTPEPVPEEKPESGITATAPTGKMEPAPAAPPPAPREPAAQTEASADAPVEIRELTMRKEGALLMLGFKLTNLDSENNAVGGYVHTLAKIEEGDPPQRLSYPVQKLQGGKPVNYRRGQPFLIQRFKPMTARFDLTQSAHPPSSIVFLVYDQSGKLILDEAFEVKDDL